MLLFTSSNRLFDPTNTFVDTIITLTVDLSSWLISSHGRATVVSHAQHVGDLATQVTEGLANQLEEVRTGARGRPCAKLDAAHAIPPVAYNVQEAPRSRLQLEKEAKTALDGKPQARSWKTPAR